MCTIRCKAVRPAQKTAHANVLVFGLWAVTRGIWVFLTFGVFSFFCVSRRVIGRLKRAASSRSEACRTCSLARLVPPFPAWRSVVPAQRGRPVGSQFGLSGSPVSILVHWGQSDGRPMLEYVRHATRRIRAGGNVMVWNTVW